MGIDCFTDLEKVAIFAESAGRLKGKESGVTAGEEVPQLFLGEGFGRMKGILRKTHSQAGLGEVENTHGSTPQGGHGTRGLISRTEFMIFGFIGDGLAEELLGGE